MFAVRAKLHQLVLNFWCKAKTPAAAVGQQVIEIPRKANVVLPQTGDGIGNSRKPLQQGQRLDLYWKTCGPSQRCRQLLVERLRPSPVPGIGRQSQLRSFLVIVHLGQWRNYGPATGIVKVAPAPAKPGDRR